MTNVVEFRNLQKSIEHEISVLLVKLAEAEKSLDKAVVKQYCGCPCIADHRMHNLPNDSDELASARLLYHEIGEKIMTLRLSQNHIVERKNRLSVIGALFGKDLL